MMVRDPTELYRTEESHANARLVRKFTVDRDQNGRGYRVCERKAHGRYGYVLEYVRSYDSEEEAKAAVARVGQLLSPWWYDGVD